MTRELAIVAVVLSVAALAISVYTASRSDKLFEEALRKRERVVVDRLKPRLLRIYADFDEEIPTATRDAQTLDDLLMPLIELVQKVTE